MVAAELMAAVYWRLFQKLERLGFNVFSDKPARLNRWQKTALIARTWFRINARAMTPDYGLP